MEDINKQKKQTDLENNLNEFLNSEKKTQKDCIGDECLINDGKEIVERVNKVYKTNDGRQLLI